MIAVGNPGSLVVASVLLSQQTEKSASGRVQTYSFLKFLFAESLLFT
jgi:hypothetical protein